MAVAVAYWPALTFTDSWAAYIKLAYSRSPVAFQDDRPSGYSLLLKTLMRPVHELAIVTSLQHLAGLCAGLLVYALLLRTGVRRSLAVVAAALVLLDAYALALEQMIATEAFFSFALVAAMFIVVVWPHSLRAIVFSGLLLGLAVTLRTEAFLAFPIWLVYLVWVRRRLLVVAAAVVALALPVLLYCGWRTAEGLNFAPVRSDGWFLYGRVAAIADGCRGFHVPQPTRPLCADRPATHLHTPDWYVWTSDSPARRLFSTETPGNAPHSNGKLRSFALSVIRARPLSYAHLVAHDFFGYFDPSYGPMTLEMILPPPHAAWPLDDFSRRLRDQYFPGYHPRSGTPASALHQYWRFVHVQRWLLAVFLLAALLVLIPAPRGARIPSRRRQVTFLLGGTGALLLLGSVATVSFQLRYLVPATPLITAAGIVALESIALAASATRTRSSTQIALNR